MQSCDRHGGVHGQHCSIALEESPRAGEEGQVLEIVSATKTAAALSGCTVQVDDFDI